MPSFLHMSIGQKWMLFSKYLVIHPSLSWQKKTYTSIKIALYYLFRILSPTFLFLVTANQLMIPREWKSLTILRLPLDGTGIREKYSFKLYNKDNVTAFTSYRYDFSGRQQKKKLPRHVCAIVRSSKKRHYVFLSYNIMTLHKNSWTI